MRCWCTSEGVVLQVSVYSRTLPALGVADAEACTGVAFYRLRSARSGVRGVREPGASTHTLSVMMHWAGRRMLQAMCVILARSSPLHLLLSWCYWGWGGCGAGGIVRQLACCCAPGLSCGCCHSEGAAEMDGVQGLHERRPCFGCTATVFHAVRQFSRLQSQVVLSGVTHVACCLIGGWRRWAAGGDYCCGMQSGAFLMPIVLHNTANTLSVPKQASVV